MSEGAGPRDPAPVEVPPEPAGSASRDYDPFMPVTDRIE
jgi:hypothetical protein